MSRVRSISYPRKGGCWSRYVHQPDIYETSVKGIEAKVTDEVNKGDGQPFTMRRVTYLGGETNQPWTNYYGTSMQDWIPACMRNNDSFYTGHLSIETMSDAAIAAKTLAESNPSRPVVDLPVFVAELKEFPQLFKLAGERLLSKMASANLSYHFGWKPLISDALKLTNFQREFDSRAKELLRMKAKGQSRRRVQCSNTSVSATTSGHTFNSNGIKYGGDVTKTSTLREWGFVTWFPTVDFPTTDAEMLALFKRAVLGLTIDAKTAWELIPFSWLVDWCSTAGDFLTANRNIIPAAHSNVLVMRQQSTAVKLVLRTTSKTLTMKDGLITVLNKSRKPYTGSLLDAQLPFLDARQLSILGSIGLLSGKNRVARR